MNHTPPKGFSETFKSLLITAEESIKKGWTIPALVIIYSSIDGFSDLAKRAKKNGQNEYKEWIKKWMLSKYPLPCNEVDLYSARNGLLHFQHSESDLIKAKRAKRLVYTWGKAETPSLQFAIDKIGETAIAVKVEDILNSFKKGMEDCLIAIYKDSDWKSSFETKCSQLFVDIGM